MPRRPKLPAAPAGTASLYVRLSRAAGDANLSKEGMVDDVLALAASEGLTVVAVHVDDGLSGAIRNRPEFTAWLDDARELRASTLVAWHVDRMTREGVNVAALILDAIEGKDPETGAVIRTPARLIDTKGLDSAGDDTAFRFRFVIAAEVARGERERMRDRARTMHRRAAAAGRYAGGQVPFGFHVIDAPDGRGRVLAVLEEEAAYVREAAARVLAGQGIASVTRWLNSPEGRPPARAREWSSTALRQVLTGKAAEGAILTPDESAALRQALARTPSPERAVRHGGRLLSGLLRCSSCGSVLRVGYRGAQRAGGARYPLYKCVTAATGGTCARGVSIGAESLERYLVDRYLSTYGSLPAYERRAEVAGAAAVEAAQLDVDAALEDLRHSATPERFQALQEAQERLREAELVPQEAVIRLVPTGLTVAEQWERTPDHRDRLELLGAALGDVVVLPGRKGGGGLDPRRLVIVDRPAAHLELDPATFRPGRPVVE